MKKQTIDKIIELKKLGMKHREISQAVFGRRSSASTVHSVLAKHYYPQKKDGAKILTLDIEAAPCLSYHWGLWKQNIGLNMGVKESYILSWAAKWAHEGEVMYEDKRNDPLNEDDSELVKSIWHLLDQADIVITQNGVRFDCKKLNTAFLFAGMKPPSPYKHIDTLLIAKKHFAFKSNKLEYMTDKFCTKYKKLPHGKFPGFQLWKECLEGNPEAWQEMEDYNKYDVLSTEELAFKLAPYSNSIPNLDLYHNGTDNVCLCGCTDWVPNGFAYTNLSKFAKFTCSNCGAHRRDRVNLNSKEKMKALRMNVA